MSIANLFSYATGYQHQGKLVAEVFQQTHDRSEWNVVTTGVRLLRWLHAGADESAGCFNGRWW
ncbi:MAG: hypothetical protein EPO28_11740 [Saprospiraceae bacterium]|nr:MAG: hypothetical protein EPO28_11740 [Saprospiraceae bacterium]